MTGGNGRDGVDRLICAALQVNGRATWGTIARVLGLPERTVVRRGQKLLDTGTVRISTYMDVARVEHARGVLLRARTEFGKVNSVAAALAQRPDASSVSILEGSGDIAALILPTSAAAHRRLLFEDLPGLDGMVSFEVGTVLRMHRSGYDWNAGGLSDEHVAQLTHGLWDVSPGNSVISIDESDHELIRLLARDGRASIARLAAETGLSLQTVRRKVDALFEAGVLHVRTEVEPALFGLHLEAMIWLHLPAGIGDEVGKALGSHPSVRFCSSSTGRNTLLIDVMVADENDLYKFQHDVIGRFQAAEIAESRIVLTAVRRGPLLVLDEHISE